MWFSVSFPIFEIKNCFSSVVGVCFFASGHDSLRHQCTDTVIAVWPFALCTAVGSVKPYGVSQFEISVNSNTA